MIFKSTRERLTAAINTSFDVMFDTINFMNNYNREDITEVERVEEKDISTVKFTLKKDIKVSVAFNSAELMSINSVIAKKEADIDDLINCTSFTYDYKDKENKYSTFKNSINEALKREGKRIQIPLTYSGCNTSSEGYVQVVNDEIYIINNLRLF